MKLLVAAITFAATLGMLFLIETGKSPKEDYAQIIEALKEENTSAAASAIPSPIKARVLTLPILSPTPLEKQNRGSSISQPNPSSSGEIGTTPIATPTPSPISPSPSPTPSTTPTPTPAPSPTPQEAGQGFINIISITSPIKRGSKAAQLSIATLPGAQCSIKVILPSRNESNAAGLKTPIEETPGNIKWIWTIGGSTTPGTATIDLNCSKDSQSFSKSLQMVITE